MSKLIGIYFNSDKKPVFRKGEGKPVISKMFCKLEGECPFLKRGKCISGRILSSGCIYGHESSYAGPSKRSKSWHTFVKSAEKEAKEGPKWPGYSENVLEVVGDYVYVPHAFLDGCKEVPFLQHSEFMSSGKPFIPVKDFTPSVVVTLSKYRRFSLMGPEISDVQKKSVPLFLFHLKQKMPGLYNEAVALEPAIVEKTLNPLRAVPLKTTLAAVPAGINNFLVGDKGATCKSWDGEWLEIQGNSDQIGSFYSGFEGAEFTIKFKPSLKKTKVTIHDPDLVVSLAMSNPELIFEVK